VTILKCYIKIPVGYFELKLTYTLWGHYHPPIHTHYPTHFLKQGYATDATRMCPVYSVHASHCDMHFAVHLQIAIFILIIPKYHAALLQLDKRKEDVLSRLLDMTL